MPRFLIYRELEGAGRLNPPERQAISAKSNDVIRQMRAEGKQIQWDHSYVTHDAINCVYIASGSDVIEEHARRGGFPCTTVSQIDFELDPISGERLSD